MLTLSLWNSEISFSSSPITEKVDSYLIPLIIWLPRKKSNPLHYSSILSSSFLPTADDPTRPVQVGHICTNLFKLGLKQYFYVTCSPLKGPSETNCISIHWERSLSLSKWENWMGLFSATQCWGWYGNKGSKNDETQIIFSCYINSCVKLLWKLTNKLG